MAGGRCRSFDDPVLGTTVDNGTHVLLGANNAALDYVRRIGAHDRLQVHAARFPFLDATSGQRWTLDLDRALPVLAPIPGVKFTHRLDVLRRLLPLLLRSGQRRRLAEVIGDNHPLAAKLLAPFVTATLNTEPDQADARLALATLARCVIAGRQGFTLHTVAESLDDTFIAPALAMLAAKGAQIDLGCAVNALDIRQNRVHALVTDGEPIPITRDDTVILAVPATAVAALLGEAAVPNRFHAIVNAHYRLGQEQAPSAGDSFVAVVGGTAQWVFRKRDLVSVTVSAANTLAQHDREAIAQRLWREAKLALGLPASLGMPHRHRVIKERRATIAHDPETVRARPGAHTRCSNLWLAGDWTDTGLPATIEGAVRSGNAAARLALACSAPGAGGKTR